jgi:hypothetical protein
MSGTPPLASDDDIAIVLSACLEGRAAVSRSNSNQTERYLRVVWGANFGRLRTAVSEHIKLRRRVYGKWEHGHQIGLQANVTLYEELNVYVEMKIVGERVVILAAHAHTCTPLPQ